ncbi:MAG: hypothetical protein M3273_03680 [Actinomycetota bacterium]|nr:hypothetical protein [Actinomycetota bacterium]
MRRAQLIASLAAGLLMLVPAPAAASPYNETCGDGTLPSCVQHCIAYHGGIRNLHNCLWAHWLV